MEMKRFLSAVAPLAIVALSAATAAPGVGQADEIENAIEYRASVMTVFRWNLKPMGAMVKGEVPYDEAEFAARAKDLAAATSLNLLSGFPEDSDMGETDAKAEIWMSWGDFEQKYEDLKTQAAKLADVAASRDRTRISTQVKATADSCKACHKKYKQ